VRAQLNMDAGWARLVLAVAAVILGSLAALADPARAALGYEPASSNPVIPLNGELPHGVAIDQSSQQIYVTEVSASSSAQQPGQVEQLESTGTPTSASPFQVGGETFFSGVAVNPVTHDIYVSQLILSTPFGNLGSSKITVFSPSGTLGTEFAVNNPPAVGTQIATDSSGRVFFPSDANNAVEVFNASGSLQATVTCPTCPGGSFQTPVSVAVDSSNDLYVVDLGLDRVMKFAVSGGVYSLDSIIQDGGDVAAVGVDPADDSVFVGSLPEGQGFHVVAYDSSGQQFDDFGAGIFGAPPYGIPSAGQIAVNATTRKVYVTDPSTNTLRVFERVTINPPTVVTNAASNVGQITAKLNATANPRFHALIDCHFEYTDHADFEANGYANATDEPCTSLPGGSVSVPVDATLPALQPSTTYHYRVVAANNAGSVTGGSQTFTTLPSAPASVTTEAATSVTQTAATFNGKVNPHGGTVTDCHFEYGLSVSYSGSVSCKQSVGPITSDVPLTGRVTNRLPETTYHYRLVVTSNAGTVFGSDQEFTTLPPPPTVTTEPAVGITQTGATIMGMVDPNGAPSSCNFEYGPTTSYGSTVPCSTDPGDGDAPVAEQADLTGLSPASTYHYRLVGSNLGGTAKGTDLSFTTLSPPPTAVPTPTPPASLPPPPVVTPPKPLKCRKGFRKAKVRGKLRCVKKKRKRPRR